MKESNFYSDEFEQLLREKTEQYKMYPSEKVWKGIHGSLHTKRRWFITGMSLLITGILFFAGRELLSPSKQELVKRSPVTAHNIADPAAAGGNDDNNASPLIALAGQRHNAANTATGRHSAASIDDRAYRGISVRLSDPAESLPDISGMLSQVMSLPAAPPSIPLIAVVHTPSPAPMAAATSEDAIVFNAGASLQQGRNVNSTLAPNMTAAAGTSANSDLPAHTARANTTKTLAVTRSGAGSVTGSETLVDSTGKAASGNVVFTDAIADQQRINWLYDYAVYNLPAAAKRGRKYFQMYASPTVTYRSLSGGELGSKTLMRGDAKDYLDHKPGLGFEVGGMMMYRVTRNLTVKVGLQFSFTRYTMKAFVNDPQRVTNDLNSSYGYYLDSMTALANFRSFNSKAQINLTNDFYQLAAPIGFELRVLGNERLQLNVAATIQPSYLLNGNGYFLTTDYMNYVKAPPQYRKWNLTGGLETFLSYKLRNGLRLQAGPEFRYQLMSSFKSGYPIHETLKGYGLKIGIVKAIP